MKRYLTIFLTLLALTTGLSTATAQETDKQRPTREQLTTAQARHIASLMAFDDATSERFIATFSRHQQELWALGPKGRKQQRKKGVQQTDAQVKQAMQERFERRQKVLDLEKKYYDEYSKFLTPKQIQRVYELQGEVMKKLAKPRKNKTRPDNKRR